MKSNIIIKIKSSRKLAQTYLRYYVLSLVIFSRPSRASSCSLLQRYCTIYTPHIWPHLHGVRLQGYISILCRPSLSAPCSGKHAVTPTISAPQAITISSYLFYYVFHSDISIITLQTHMYITFYVWFNLNIACCKHASLKQFTSGRRWLADYRQCSDDDENHAPRYKSPCGRSQQTGDYYTMSGYYWPIVFDVGPT